MNKLEEILLSDNVVEAINSNMDYILEIMPEMKRAIGFDQKNPNHHLDVWNHTLLALSKSEKDYDIRLTLLLHDIGKPYSYQEGKIRHFYNHARISNNIAKRILMRLGYNSEYVIYICSLIKNHDTPITLEQIESEYDYYLKLYKIQKCDALAHHPDKLEDRKKYIETIEGYLSQVENEMNKTHKMK